MMGGKGRVFEVVGLERAQKLRAGGGTRFGECPVSRKCCKTNDGMRDAGSGTVGGSRGRGKLGVEGGGMEGLATDGQAGGLSCLGCPVQDGDGCGEPRPKRIRAAPAPGNVRSVRCSTGGAGSCLGQARTGLQGRWRRLFEATDGVEELMHVQVRLTDGAPRLKRDGGCELRAGV